MQDKQNANYWYGRMSGHLSQFQNCPSKEARAAMLMALSEYQKAVADGLTICKRLPEPLRNAKTFSAWYRRQLEEALAMFQINPSADRLSAMEEHLTGYLDAVATGRVKP